MAVIRLLLSQSLLFQALTILTACISFVLAQASTQTSVAPSWPAGTQAQGSSVHAQLSDGTTFSVSNAVDGNLTTKWNDDSLAAYPDSLTISIPIVVTLVGIIIVSSEDGWLLTYTVETYNGTAWTTVADIGNSSSPFQLINFLSPVIARKVRINVTQDQSGIEAGEYTRIHEVYPLFGTLPSSESNSASNSTSAPHTDQCTCKKSSNAGAIAGGVVGGVVAIILAALAAIFMLRTRRSRGGIDGPEPKSNLYPQGLIPNNRYPAANTYEAAGDTPHTAHFAPPTELRQHAAQNSGTADVTQARWIHEVPAEPPNRTTQNVESSNPDTARLESQS